MKDEPLSQPDDQNLTPAPQTTEPGEYPTALPTRDFTPPKPGAHKPKRNWRKPLLIAAIIVVVLAAAALAYLKFGRHSAKTTTSTKQSSSSSQAASNDTTPTKTVPTKSYTSPNFNVSFNYPEAWTVNDKVGAPLTVTSPAMQFVDAGGNSVTGQVVAAIQQKGQVPAAFGDSSIAVMDSTKVSYTQPSPDQRGQTYLSFVQYPATKTTGALDGIYITGNSGYKKAQNIPKADVANVDPLVTVTFVKCADSNCSGTPAALGIKASDWSDDDFQAPIKTLLTSLTFQ